MRRERKWGRCRRCLSPSTSAAWQHCRLCAWLANVNMDAAVLLTAIAACPALEAVLMEWDHCMLFEVQSKRQQQLLQAGSAKAAGMPAAQRGLAALAAGACSKTLRCLKVQEGWCFSPEEVAALLQGSMRALQVVELVVELVVQLGQGEHGAAQAASAAGSVHTGSV